MKIVKTCPCPVQEKFLSTRKELSGALIERDGEVDLVLAALVAREHILLVGPPGCGKSLLLDGVMNWMNGKRFSILLTKFTCPEEVVGPVSIAALKEDRYRRVTTGKLPEADLCFLDEVFKASSAISNTLLRISNERVFEDGDGGFVRVPLELCVAASNEWPQSQEGGKELAALFDRFAFRRAVRPILSGAGRKRLLWERDHTPTLSTSITPAEVDQAHADAMALPWSKDGRGQDEQGRLWNVVWRLRHAAKSSQGDTIFFYLHVRHDNHRAKRQQLKATCGPDEQGSLCVTVLLPIGD